MWKNESGTFMTFLANNTTIYYNEGYLLHKLFPQLKFIFRSIDEGFPNHCGMWEFAQDDPISDELEPDLNLAHKIRKHLFLSHMFGNSQESYQRECLRMCGNDLEKAQRIHHLFQSLIEKRLFR